MSPELLQLRQDTDLNWGTIVWVLDDVGENGRTGRDELWDFCVSRADGNQAQADDYFQSAIERLATDQSPRTVEILRDANHGEVVAALVMRAKNVASKTGHSNRREVRESSHEAYDSDRDDRLDASVDPLEALSNQNDLLVIRECLATAVDGKTREAMVLRFAHDMTLKEIAKRQGGSEQAAHKRLKAGETRASFMYRSITSGQRCPEIEGIFATAVFSDELSEADRVALDAHIEHCVGCRNALAQSRRRTRAAAALFPAPLLALHGHLGVGLLESVKSLWASLTHRSAEAAAPVASSPALQSAKPIAAGAAAITLLLGGGAAVVKTRDGGEHHKKTAVATQAPKALYTEVDVPAVKRPEHKKKPKKKERAVVPAPAQRQAAPVQTQSAPQTKSQSVGDGSSEFLPEER